MCFVFAAHPAFTDAEIATYRNEANRCIEEGDNFLSPLKIPFFLF